MTVPLVDVVQRDEGDMRCSKTIATAFCVLNRTDTQVSAPHRANQDSQSDPVDEGCFHGSEKQHCCNFYGHHHRNEFGCAKILSYH